MLGSEKTFSSELSINRPKGMTMLSVRKHLFQRRADAKKGKLPPAWLAIAMKLSSRFRGYPPVSLLPRR